LTLIERETMQKKHLSRTKKYVVAAVCAATVMFSGYKKAPDALLPNLPDAGAQSFHNEKRTAELAKRLKDNEAWVRRDAAEALGNSGDPTALPALADTARKDKEWEVREKAVEAIARIAVGLHDAAKSGEARKTLESALSDANERVRECAARALGRFGARGSVESLTKKLGDPMPGVRCGSAWALGTIGHEGSATALQRALSDPSWAVRKEAAWGLGSLGEKNRGSAIVVGSAPHLVKALDDPDPRVQETAAWALGRLGVSTVAAHLVRALRSAEPGVVREAAVSLGIVANPSSIPDLMRVAMYGEQDLRVKAITAVGNIAGRHPGNPEVVKVVPPLLMMLGYDSLEIGRAAVTTLGKTGDARAIPSLLAVAKGKSPEARENAVSALGSVIHFVTLNSLAGADTLSKNSVDQARSTIIEALNDPEETVRRAAAVALGGLGEPESAGPLAKAAMDIGSGIRKESILALGVVCERNQGNKKVADEALPALFEALRTNTLRNEAIEALGKLGDRRALPALRKLSAEPDATTSSRAGKAIAAISKKKPSESIDDLTKGFKPSPNAKPNNSLDGLSGGYNK
jgi:HEAT repeat protein